MNALQRTTGIGALLGLCLGGCALPSMKAINPEEPPEPVAEVVAPSRAVQPAEPRATAPEAPAATPEAPPVRLYARDGSVVGEQAPGSVAVVPEGSRSVAPDSGTRWTLLEQYQEAISKNEDLEFELAAMASALDQGELREQQLAARIDALQQELEAMKSRVVALEDQNIELASRLTTAQIRRLQSEKLLLEAKLDWKRVEAMMQSQAASGEPEPEPAPAGSPLDDGPLGGGSPLEEQR
jgi:hypothetical protein